MDANAQMPKPGRPTKYTAEVIEAILVNISQGLSYRLAAQLAGIDYDTFNQWRKTYSEFSERVEQAEAKPIKIATDCIFKGMEKDWKAAGWFLERRSPNDYAKPKDWF